MKLSFLIVGGSNLQLIISSCLTVYLIVLFPVKYLNRLLTIHQTISLLNSKLTTRLILVLLCLLTTVLTGVRDKIRWSKFTMENILTSYASPIAEELNNMNLADYNSLANSTEQIKNFMLKHSAPLVTPVRNNKSSKKVYFRLPDDVKSARLQGKDAYDSWKRLNFPREGDVHETYRATRKEYRQKLGSFLDQTEADRIRKLCHAAESNEKLFWKLVKSQRSSSQMSAFLVNGDLLTDKKAIRAMWADHFEALGTPSEIATFDKGFFTKVTDSVREVFSTFVNDPNGICITTGVIHFSLLFVKSLRWFSSKDWKILLNKWGSSQICNLGSKKGSVARKPHLLF